MKQAIQITHVEYCGECPFAEYRNFFENGTRTMCTQLTDEDYSKPIDYVPTEQSKGVRADCPLPNVEEEKPVVEPEPIVLPPLTINDVLREFRLAIDRAHSWLRTLAVSECEMIVPPDHYGMYHAYLIHSIGCIPLFDEAGEEVVTYRGVRVRAEGKDNQINLQVKQRIR